MGPAVLDSLIAKREGHQARYNRSFEYDFLGDRYARRQGL